jgi:carbon storage regulator
MLMVRRRAGESILIGGEIEIQVTEITATRVTLGIVAPREIPVVRGEVRLTRDQNLAAASDNPPIESLTQLAGTLRLR